jgi:hypothetical protein
MIGVSSLSYLPGICLERNHDTLSQDSDIFAQEFNKNWKMYSLSTVTNHRRSLSGFLQPGKCMFISIAVRFNNTAGLIGTQRARSLLYGYLHAGELCRFDIVKFIFL